MIKLKYLLREPLTPNEKLFYERGGFFCYDLRENDFDNIISTIEKNVLVNRAGSLLTNKQIDFGENDFVDYYKFCESNEQVEKIQDLISNRRFKEHPKTKRYNNRVYERTR